MKKLILRNETLQNKKGIIIEANDNTHSFMEWLEILDTNITVSINRKRAK
ncbi:MAG: hypothetical protein IPN09_15345 [Bacteroidetes bacterium]|nr:hypothetical protein [Bacteroidota bacterium]